MLRKETIMKYNMCSYFLPQLIGINKLVEGFKNCYIMDTKDEEEPFKHIYILMDKTSSLLDIHPYTVSRRETKDGNLYKITVNDRFYEDLSKFYEGKYSKMSTTAKQVILENCGISVENSLAYSVLYKTDKRRKFLENFVGEKLDDDAELMSILNLNKEIYEN